MFRWLETGSHEAAQVDPEVPAAAAGVNGKPQPQSSFISSYLF